MLPPEALGTNDLWPVASSSLSFALEDPAPLSHLQVKCASKWGQEDGCRHVQLDTPKASEHTQSLCHIWAAPKRESANAQLCRPNHFNSICFP